jgi:hypothetical protein
MAVVMGKRVYPKFPGELGRPIQKPLVFPFGVTTGSTEREQGVAYEKRVRELRFEKLVMLFKYYGIPPENDWWPSLAWHLACDFVPGMQVVDRLPRRARPHEKWGLELEHRFCDEIDAIRAEPSRPNIDAAIKIARERHPNDWSKYKVPTLETRYYELKRSDAGAISCWVRSQCLAAFFPSTA